MIAGDITGFAEEVLSCDDFLGGQLRLLQPVDGYRAATDPIYLAAACPARPGDSVLELGCGVGTLALALGCRVPGLNLVGVEKQADYADLARRNSLLNRIAMDVVTGDLRDASKLLAARCFDHVVMNPPYYGPGKAAEDAGRDMALREDTPLDIWIASALSRLRPKGWISVIHLAERLPDILVALNSKAGALEIKPLAARPGRPAKRVIVRARKGARAPATLFNPLILHRGESHLKDEAHFTKDAEAILRHAAPLAF